MARKNIFNKSELEQLLAKKDSSVFVVQAAFAVLMHPFYLNNVKRGIYDALYTKLKRYDSFLEGIPLGYDNIKVVINEGKIVGRNGEPEYPVQCKAYLFQPVVGGTLTGKVTVISSHHISCLVHKYFNVTIKRPDDETYEDWRDRTFEFGDIITFRVKDLDYTTEIPYIEGELIK